MAWVLLHFLVGALVSGVLVLVFSYLSGERIGSVVFLPVVVGVVCAAVGHSVGSWATAAVLALVATSMWCEHRGV